MSKYLLSLVISDKRVPPCLHRTGIAGKGHEASVPVFVFLGGPENGIAGAYLRHHNNILFPQDGFLQINPCIIQKRTALLLAVNINLALFGKVLSVYAVCAV